MRSLASCAWRRLWSGERLCSPPTGPKADTGLAREGHQGWLTSQNPPFPFVCCRREQDGVTRSLIMLRAVKTASCRRGWSTVLGEYPGVAPEGSCRRLAAKEDDSAGGIVSHRVPLARCRTDVLDLSPRLIEPGPGVTPQSRRFSL